MNIFPNYGGASHDSYVWNNSSIKRDLEQLRDSGEQVWLIGDSGYPQSSIMMTPFRDPQPGTPHYRYYEAHVRARNTVERCIGLLKVRFRCILKERNGRYSPEMIAKFVKVSAALHNLCLESRFRDNYVEFVYNFVNEMDDGNRNIEIYNDGNDRERNDLVRRYFM